MSYSTQHIAARAANARASAACARFNVPFEGPCTRFALLCITLFGLKSGAPDGARARALIAHASVWLCALGALLFDASVRCVSACWLSRRRSARRDMVRPPRGAAGRPPNRVGRAPPA